MRQPAAADAGVAALVPRPRDGGHAAERVRRPGGRLPDPGRLRRLPGQRARLPRPRKTRYITLNEIAPGTAGWHLNLNAVDFEQKPVPETPKAGTVEDWVWVNMTPDTHPMHGHLVTFQVVGRTPFDVNAYRKKHGGPNGVPGGISPQPFAIGPMEPPTRRARLQRHGQSQPRILHHHPREIRPA
jgi:FtsP/CotA-like multicopper oxidase with cupredoxin domain